MTWPFSTTSPRVTSYLMYHHIKLATTAGLTLVGVITILNLIGSYFGVHLRFEDVKNITKNICISCKYLHGTERIIIDTSCVIFIIILALKFFIKFCSQVITLCREHALKLTGLLLLGSWTFTHFKFSEEVTSTWMLNLLILSLGYILGRLNRSSPSPAKPHIKGETNPTMRLGQLEHVIIKETSNKQEDSKIIQALMKRIESLEERIDRTYFAQPALQRFDMADDSGETSEDGATVELSSSDKSDEEVEVRISPEEMERLTHEVNEERPKSSVGDKPRQHYKKTYPLRRSQTPINGPRPKTKKCPHCADLLTKEHKCWVLQRKMKCYKCGGPNHIAIACKNKGFGMQLEVHNQLSEEQITKEMERLQRLLALKKQQDISPDAEIKDFLFQTPQQRC